ncbi:cell division protein FtsH, partial [Schumannella luteola]
MDFKRIFRGPLIYIILGVVILIVGFNLITAAAGFKQVTTQQGLELLGGSTVESVKIVDGEQRVDLTLSKAYSSDDADYGTQVQFYYVQPRGDEVIQAITDSKAKFDDEVPQTNWFTSLLGI